MLVIAAVLILVGTFSKNWITGGRGSRDVHIGPMGIEACMSSVCVPVPSGAVHLDSDIEIIMVLAMISGFAAAGAAGTFGGMAFAGKRHAPFAPKIANIAFGLAAFSMTFFLIRMISEKGDISWAGFPAIGGVILAGIGLKKLTPFLVARPALPPGQSQGVPPQAPYGQPGQQPMQPQPQYGSQPYPQNPQGSQPMQPPHGSQPYAQQPQPGSQPYAQQPQHGSQPYAQQPQHGSQAHAQPMAPSNAPPQQAAVPNCPRCGTQLHYVAQYQRWFCPREQQYV